jgi:6-pyruvoyltetrahydropterin/6-carboxytetrahydropterin synthase
MMLPTRNPLIIVKPGQSSVHVRYREREWLFPLDDCVLLPIENTTAELLARYIAHRLLDAMKREQYVPRILRVEVEENIGQSATCEIRSAVS